MKQYAFIGLGALARNMLENIAQVTDQIVVVDINPVTIDRVKDLVNTAYVADATDADALARILPDGLDVAVVDLADHLEASILVTYMLKKRGVPEIIVKAKNETKSAILEIVGATRVVLSDKEAANRIVPLILSSALYNFMPIGSEMVMAEVLIPPEFVGKSLVEADLRRSKNINVVTLRSESTGAYREFDPNYKLQNDDVLLIAGKEADVFAFSGIAYAAHTPAKKDAHSFFRTLFKAKARDQ